MKPPGAAGIFLVGTRRPAANRENRRALWDRG
jgi:hypothetical protein